MLRKFRAFLSSRHFGQRHHNQPTVVLVESALLCEASLTSWVNHCVVVMNHDEDESRLKRLVDRGMTQEDALDRIAMQWTDSRRQRWLAEDIREAGFGGMTFSRADQLINPGDTCGVVQRKVAGLMQCIDPLIQL